MAASFIPPAGKACATLRLDPLFRYSVYAVFAALFLSGAGWLIADAMKGTAEGEIAQAVSANLLMLHGGAAMVALLMLGALIPIHMLRAWRAGKNTLTGVSMAGLNAVLIVTAFCLYYLGSETVRAAMSDVHWIAGFALPILLVSHIYLGRWRRQKDFQQRKGSS